MLQIYLILIMPGRLNWSEGMNIIDLSGETLWSTYPIVRLRFIARWSIFMCLFIADKSLTDMRRFKD